MKLRYMSIEDLIAAGNTAAINFTDKLGYDQASFEAIDIRDSGVNVRFWLHDDFCDDPDWRDNTHGSVTISLEGAASYIDQFYAAIEAWPNREQRELAEMATNLAKVGASTDKMTTMKVKAFVDRIKDDQNRIAKLVHYVD